MCVCGVCRFNQLDLAFSDYAIGLLPCSIFWWLLLLDWVFFLFILFKIYVLGIFRNIRSHICVTSYRYGLHINRMEPIHIINMNFAAGVVVVDVDYNHFKR